MSDPEVIEARVTGVKAARAQAEPTGREAVISSVYPASNGTSSINQSTSYSRVHTLYGNMSITFLSLPPRKKPLPMTLPLLLVVLIQLVLIGHQWVMLLSLPMMPFPLLLLVDHKQALDLEQ